MKKVVKEKWVLRRKLLSGGELDKLKARIVAKGFTQREGIDYEETFSPTVRFESVRLMVATAAADGLHTHQMDVTTAFLYASLDEIVYMELMEGMDGYGTPGKVARLWKAIYGLKQASRMWNLPGTQHRRGERGLGRIEHRPTRVYFRRGQRRRRAAGHHGVAGRDRRACPICAPGYGAR